MARALGYILLSTPFVGFLGASLWMVGVLATLGIVALTAVIVGCIGLGFHLLEGK